MIEAASAYGVEVGRPIRRHRAEFVREEALKNAVLLAKAQPDCAGILLLFDADDDCPKELIGDLERWAKSAAGDVPCEVVVANREYEAWFLAAMESLRGVRGIGPSATSHPHPEEPRSAKGQLEARMTPRAEYAETTDQAAFSAKFDLASAHRACRSFRRLAKAFALVVTAAGVNVTNWPPPDWVVG